MPASRISLNLTDADHRSKASVAGGALIASIDPLITVAHMMRNVILDPLNSKLLLITIQPRVALSRLSGRDLVEPQQAYARL